MIFIGIDNGVSGSIGIIDTISEEVFYYKTPVVKSLNYTKSKQWMNRIDVAELWNILKKYKGSNASIAIERPMVNPMRFKASTSALRALEATLIVIERLQFSYRYLDSKEWQHVLLPKQLESNELKIASIEVCKRIFPKLNLTGFKDADGILIAEYLRRVSNENR